MDGSNGNNAGTSGGGSNPNNPSPSPQQQQQRMHPGDSSRAVRAELEAKRRATIEKHRRFQPPVREQIGRVFGDTAPAWYARARLLTRASYAQLAELSVVGLAVGHDRLLSDGEARAVTEHVARGADRMALISWSLTGLAALLTWRGRRTLRFPLWTPQAAPPPPGAILRKTMWHGARYIAYSVATSVTLQAPLMAYNVMYEKQQMAVDERLRQLVRDEEGNYMGRKKEAEDWSSSSFGSGGGGDDSQQQQQQQQSIQEAAQTGWDTYKQSEQQQQQQQQQYGQRMQSQASNAGWGSSSSSSSSDNGSNYGQSSSRPTQQSSSGWDSADVDDASPVAGSAPGDSPSSYGGGGGSTWDRLRQQSQRASPQQQQQQQQQQRWGGQQSPPQQQQQQPGGQLSWGDAGDGVDRAAQDKAQREFDQLVDRDRSGEAQGRSGWGGR